MTDITELAQRVKTEVSAIDDTQWYLAKPSEIRLLVEALEKAQQKIQAHERAELTWMNALELPDDATRNDILPAIHAEKYTLRAANKRFAELESRTVDLPIALQRT